MVKVNATALFKSAGSWLDSGQFVRAQNRDVIGRLMAEWKIKSAGEAAIDYVRLFTEADMRAGRGDGLAPEQTRRFFAAFYALCVPRAQYDSVGYWQKPGDEVERDPATGNMKERDTSRFIVGDPVCHTEGNPRSSDYRVITQFVDPTMPYREALVQMVGAHAPKIPEGRKHAAIYQIFDLSGWYDGFVQVAGDPAAVRKMAAVFAMAGRAKAKAYFSAPPLERDILRDLGQELPANWSRAQQFEKYQTVYVIRSNPRAPASVETLSVSSNSEADKIFRKGLDDYIQEKTQARSNQRERVVVNAR